MKVLHIVSGNLNGGAARGSYWLHRGLKELGVDSNIFTNSRIALDDDSVVSGLKSKKDKFLDILRNNLENFILYLYPKRKKIIFSTGFFGVDFTKTKEYKESNIIHLHWINLGFVNIKHLAKIDKPIVWTLRDMWPMTGGCHYSMECEKYKKHCGRCEQLASNSEYDLSRIIIIRKNFYFPKHMKIVGISKWISEKAKESYLFSKFEVRTIPNNIDTREFYPINKNIARNILGIKTDKKIILTGSINSNDPFKGFSKYLEALKILDKNSYFLCFFGKFNKELIDDLGFEYKSFGFLNDNISLRLAYSCADVFVAPSIVEAFGKTLAESMACGTPVVCFDVTGQKDIVDHKINGYKARPHESEDLAYGIEWILNNPNYDALCAKAREKVVKEFDSKVVAEKYIRLYEEILSTRHKYSK